MKYYSYSLGIIVILVFLSMSCSKEQGYNETYVSNNDYSDHLYYENTIVYDSSFIIVDSVYGPIKYFYHYNEITGLQQLDSNNNRLFEIVYYPDSVKKVECAFFNNKMHGYYKLYYRSGKLQQQGTFEDGLKFGWWEEYEEDGTIKWSGYMDNNQKHGFFMHYENGILASEGTFEDNNKWGLWKYYDVSTGELQQIIEYD